MKRDTFKAIKGELRIASEGFNDFDARRLACVAYDRKGDKADDDSKVLVGTPVELEGVGTNLMMSEEVCALHFKLLEEATAGVPANKVKGVINALVLPLITPSGANVTSYDEECVVNDQFYFARVNQTLTGSLN